MDFSVTIEGLDKLQSATKATAEAIQREIDIAAYVSAQKIVTEAKRSILDGQKSGRIYKHRSVIHRASAPGEAPASDTGRLVNSLIAEQGRGEASAIAGKGNVIYARMLEFGTALMAARPFFFPAFEKSKAFIIQRMNDAVRRAVAK